MCIQFLMGNKFSSKFSKHLCSASNKRGTKRKLENDTDSPQSSDKEEASSQAGESPSPGTGSNFEVGLAPLSDIHTPKRLDCEYIDTHLVFKKSKDIIIEGTYDTHGTYLAVEHLITSAACLNKFYILPNICCIVQCACIRR